MYMFVKHLHLTAVALSILLFTLRFIWLLRESALLNKKWVKVVPHIIDTLLLASAITLCVLLSQYPLVNGWLTEKVVGVVLYIVLGLWTLKWAKSKPQQIAGFVLALLVLLSIAKIAVLKQPLLLG